MDAGGRWRRDVMSLVDRWVRCAQMGYVRIFKSVLADMNRRHSVASAPAALCPGQAHVALEPSILAQCLAVVDAEAMKAQGDLRACLAAVENVHADVISFSQRLVVAASTDLSLRTLHEYTQGLVCAMSDQLALRCAIVRHVLPGEGQLRYPQDFDEIQTLNVLLCEANEEHLLHVSASRVGLHRFPVQLDQLRALLTS